MSMIQDIIRLPHGLLGVAAGHFDGLDWVHNFGANFDIDNNSVPETIWSAGGLYPWASLATAQTLYVLSTEAADTADVKIEGLDANFYRLTETVTLTGTTAVTTSNQFSRIFRMSYNHGSENVGTITARVTADDGTIVGQIDAAFAQSLMAVYTIPAGYTGYLLTGDASVQKTKDAQIKFFTRPFGQSFRISHMAEVYERTYRYDFLIPLPIPEKTDLDVRADNVETNNTRVTCNFDILLERN
jgi:hypothetical protein